ncbi:tRNA methyltransferase 6 non-catalytic subunit [Lycorma delicatula]|uniref:tRNA methyltransferase 6 non-catalytic subunit n=1 Tax=Lycorma delicatula TaxID=130591 RepID=UPI003F50DE77
MTEDSVSNDNLISVGKYIIINRKKFSKLHLLTENSVIFLGKDKVNLSGTIGYPFWSTFKMVPTNAKLEFKLTRCSNCEINECNEFLKSKSSGIDNRNIWDDGNSQLLSTEKIIELRDSGLSSNEIVGCLVENSKTFHTKTEYSQEKYLKKKGTKYFEYLTIKKPSIRILSELFYLKEPTKILGLRTDSLSQIMTAVNLQPDGKYILYENGSQGLVAATILNYLSGNGKLIYITSGKHPQKHAILAMNSSHKLDQMKCIQLTTLIEKSDCTDSNDENMFKEVVNSKEENSKEINFIKTDNFEVASLNGEKESGEITQIPSEENYKIEGNCKNTFSDKSDIIGNKNNKRKNDLCNDEECSPAKKPRWELDAEEAMNMLNLKNNDGLIIVCKEYPSNVLLKLLSFIEPSRPFVVFCLYREPLSQLYVELKLRHDLINLRLTETWLRTYQVLPNRTHPDVLMSGNSGYLLTGTVVNNL